MIYDISIRKKRAENNNNSKKKKSCVMHYKDSSHKLKITFPQSYSIFNLYLPYNLFLLIIIKLQSDARNK